MKQIYFIDGLSILEKKLGSPSWFWPAVLAVMFIGVPLLVSAIDYGAIK